MKNIKGITSLAVSSLVVSSLLFNSVNAQTAQNVQTVEYKTVTPIEVVAKPAAYLNQNIKINATFDKFSTLGLDYKPAFRDSQDYIAFLIKRDDVTDHTIPLSEMKIFIKRKDAEKTLLDIESGDKIEFSGKVFSTALNDPWIQVDNIKVLTHKTKTVAKNKK